jgi:hypothetical protein
VCSAIRLMGMAAAVGTVLLLSQAAPVAAAPRRPAVLFAGVAPSRVRTWDDWLASGYEVDARRTTGRAGEAAVTGGLGSRNGSHAPR